MDKVPFCCRSFTHPEESGMPGALVPALALHVGWAREAGRHGKRAICPVPCLFMNPAYAFLPAEALESASPRPDLSCPEEVFSDGCASGAATIGLNSPADFCLICHLTRYTTPWWNAKRISQSRGCLSGESCPLRACPA